MSKDQAIGGAILAICIIVIVGYLLITIDPGILGLDTTATRLDAVLILVSAGFIAILAIGAWIGWTMATTPPPKPIEEITTETEGKTEEMKQGEVPAAPATPVVPAPAAVETRAQPVAQSTVAETPKAEPTSVEEVKVEALHVEEEMKAEPSPTPVKATKDRGSKVIDVEGIGPVYANKLNEININTTADLLEAGATPAKRKELAQKTGISDKLILRWINMADLFRIKGVGEEYSDLLEAAGVDTVVELAKRVPENLHVKMLEVNAEKNLVRRPPALSDVKQWIQEAKTLPRKIEY
jgi:predicted flap endonuclease-1-like 5' DNA nuclease/predicted DNA-binding transcriptional regulator